MDELLRSVIVITISGYRLSDKKYIFARGRYIGIVDTFSYKIPGAAVCGIH